ncbi:MAG: hypothetical protein ACLFR6_06915 [Salinarchaeum sp.]
MSRGFVVDAKAPNGNGDNRAETATGCGEGTRGQQKQGGKGPHHRGKRDSEGPHHRGKRDGQGPHRRGNDDGNGPHHRDNHDDKNRSKPGDCDGDRRKRRGRKRRGRKRDAHGRFADSVTGEDVLGVFEAVEGPVVTSTDVGDVLGISTESARQHLNNLVSEGPLRRRKTGRTVVYWTTDTTGGD